MPLIKNSMVADLPNIKITSTADITENTIQTEATLNPLSVDTTSVITHAIHPSTGEVSDHRELSHLDYETSGHTGFASAKDLQAVIPAAAGQSGQFNEDALKQLKTNYSTKIEKDAKLLSLTTRGSNNWTYTSAIDPETGDMEILTLDPVHGYYQVQTRNPAQDELNAHIQNQDVHVRAGERTTWNNKVRAEVDVANQELFLER